MLAVENKKRRRDKRKPEEKIVVSLNDPESVFGLDKEKVYRPLYNVQTVSDLKTDFVLGYGVFAQHSDSGTLQPLMNKIHTSGIQVNDLLADAGYPFAIPLHNGAGERSNRASRSTSGRD